MFSNASSPPSWRSAGHSSGLVGTVLALCAWLGALVVLLFFGWMFSSLILGGAGALSFEFLTTLPRRAGIEGGIAPVLVSTFWILAICLAVALPLGLGTALYLAEFSAPQALFTRLVRHSLAALAAVPSIVFGLFGNAFFCIVLKMGFSLLSGGLTLACMVLPLLIVNAEAGLRAFPLSQRQAAASVGLSRPRTIFALILPAALPAIAAGTILAVGRALAETAALLFTSGYVDRMPTSVFDSGRTLSIHIYDLSMNVPGGEAHAYASALVLLAMLFFINGVVLWVSRHWRKKSAAT